MDAQTLLRRVSESLSVRRAFGEPIEQHGFSVIPVAFVAGGGGGGGGQAPKATNPEKAASDTEAGTDDTSHGAGGTPSGSGGGLGGVVVPMGVYVIRSDKVVWKPAVQPILLAVVVLNFTRVVMRAGARRRVRSRR